MFDSIYNIIYEIVYSFVDFVDQLYYNIFPEGLGYFQDVSFNIYLFSDTGWFSVPLRLDMLVPLIAGIFIFIFILRLLYQTTKKIIVKVFGVFKV